MPQSTAKKQLLEQQFGQVTPVKMVVSREINSWMQTNEKNQILKQKNQSVDVNKFKISKRSVRHNIFSQRNSSANDQNLRQLTNVLQLKKRRDNLMNSLSNQKWMNQNTKQSTVQNGHSSKNNKKPMQWFMRLPLIHVNQFIVEQKEKKQFHQVTLIPQCKPLQDCQPCQLPSKKTSLKRIDRNQKQKTAYCHYLQTKKRNRQIKNSETLQQKLTINQYSGLLTSIARKSTNILISKQRKLKS